jgi:hypothetical protein
VFWTLPCSDHIINERHPTTDPRYTAHSHCIYFLEQNLTHERPFHSPLITPAPISQPRPFPPIRLIANNTRLIGLHPDKRVNGDRFVAQPETRQ